MIRPIEIETIDASGRLRPIRPDWVEAFAEQIAAGDELPPIEVVERPEGGWRLITGAHRLAGIPGVLVHGPTLASRWTH